MARASAERRLVPGTMSGSADPDPAPAAPAAPPGPAEGSKPSPAAVGSAGPGAAPAAGGGAARATEGCAAGGRGPGESRWGTAGKGPRARESRDVP